MRLKSLVLNNIYSFGEGVQCVFTYAGESVRTLISGVNKDDPGADSNGSGKSNILNSIYWIIFGEVFQEENVDSIIRLGQTWCSGALEMVDDKGSTIKISRGRGAGKRKFLTLEVNKESKTTLTDEKTQLEILKYLQISPLLKASEYCNDFINTVYFSSDVAKGFMGKKTTSKERFQLIERFLNLKRYTYASESAKAKKQEAQTELNAFVTDMASKEDYITNHPTESIKTRMGEIQGELIKIQNTMLTLTDKIKNNTDRKSLLNLIPQKKSALETHKASLRQHFTSLENELNTNTKRVEDENKALAAYTSLELQIKSDKVTADEAQKQKTTFDIEHKKVAEDLEDGAVQLATTTMEINSIRNQISNHLKCPQCQTSLMLSGVVLKHVNVEELAIRLAELESNRNKIVTLNQANANRNNELKNLIDERVKIIQYLAAMETNLQRLRKPEDIQNRIKEITDRSAKIVEEYNKLSASAEQSVQTMTAEITDLEQRLSTIGDPDFDVERAEAELKRHELTKTGFNKELGQCEEQIKTIEATKAEIVALTEKINTKKKVADIYGFWEIGFRQMKLDIIDQFLPDFENEVNEHLIRLKVSLRVRFDTQKEKVSASKRDKEEGRAYKEEFNVEVFKEGKEPLPYGLMSKGQRGRIGGCVGIALRELTKERGNNVFDFFFLDEIADALDESGLRELVQMLDELPGQKLVISHNDLMKDMFEDRIVVEIENDVSTIRQVV